MDRPSQSSAETQTPSSYDTLVDVSPSLQSCREALGANDRFCFERSRHGKAWALVWLTECICGLQLNTHHNTAYPLVSSLWQEPLIRVLQTTSSVLGTFLRYQLRTWPSILVDRAISRATEQRLTSKAPAGRWKKYKRGPVLLCSSRKLNSSKSPSSSPSQPSFATLLKTKCFFLPSFYSTRAYLSENFPLEGLLLSFYRETTAYIAHHERRRR